MAVITHFEVIDGRGKLQPTEVKARLKIVELADAHPIVQIDTYGSADRELAGKQSQTIQLTRERAIELHGILARVYGL